MTEILRPQDFDPSHLIFQEPKKGKRGGKIINVRYRYPNGREMPLRVHMPKMNAPFGASPPFGDPFDLEQLSVEVSLERSKDPKIDQYAHMLELIEQRLKEETFNNAAEWIEVDDDDESYVRKTAYSKVHSLFRYSKSKENPKELNKDYPARHKFKIKRTSMERYNTKIFDSSKQQVQTMMEILNFTKRIGNDGKEGMKCQPCQVKGIIELSYVSVVGTTGVSATFSGYQIQVFPIDEADGCMISDSDDDNQTSIPSTPMMMNDSDDEQDTPEDDDSTPADESEGDEEEEEEDDDAALDQAAEELDEEEESEPSPEPSPEPAPKTKRRVRRTKK